MLEPTVLFDLDGVLVHSADAWWKSVEAALVRFNGRQVTRAEFDACFGQGTHADIEAWCMRCTVEELDRFYVESLPQFVDQVAVDPLAGDVTRLLKLSDFKLAVVTNSVPPLARLLVERAGISSSLDAVVGPDAQVRSKPAPDLLERAMQLVGANRDLTWMVGDSRYDREAAAAARVRFIGLRTDGDERIERLVDLLGILPLPTKRR